jgi:ubiquinone/menaquinone biosynthesis C-methylase UbiE
MNLFIKILLRLESWYWSLLSLKKGKGVQRNLKVLTKKKSRILNYMDIYHVCEMSRVIQGSEQVAFVGAGSGTALLLLARANPHIYFTGFESSFEDLQVGRRKIREQGLRNVRIRHSLLTNLEDITDNQFDAIVSAHAMHTMLSNRHLEMCISEMRRILKTNGAFYLAEYQQQTSPAMIRRLAKRLPNAKGILEAAISETDILELVSRKLPTNFTAFQTASLNIMLTIKTAKKEMPAYTQHVLQQAMSHLTRKEVNLLSEFRSLQDQGGLVTYRGVDREELYAKLDEKVKLAIFADRERDEDPGENYISINTEV